MKEKFTFLTNVNVHLDILHDAIKEKLDSVENKHMKSNLSSILYNISRASEYTFDAYNELQEYIEKYE